MSKTFSRTDTNVLKGIAILAMVFHHTYRCNPGLSILDVTSFDFFEQVSATGKICVSLLTILSGYGLAVQYSKKEEKTIKEGIKFSISHYIQLLSIIIPLILFKIIIEYILGMFDLSFYGTGYKRIIYIVFDILGIGKAFDFPAMIGDWFLPAIILFYFIFPILYRLIKKLKWIIPGIFFIPWIYYLIVNDITMHTDWWLFYTDAFALGIILAQEKILDHQMNSNLSKKNIIISIVCFFVLLMLRQIFTLPVDVLLSFGIIELYIFVIQRAKVLTKPLELFGKHSANIWLMHGFFTYIICSELEVGYIIKFLISFSSSLLFSILFTKLKSVTRYDNLIKSIRRKIG